MDDVRMDMGAMAIAVLSRWRRILLVTLILLGATFAVLQFTPKMYQSTAGLLVEPRQSAYTRASADTAQSTTTAVTEGLVASQIELLKSRDTLRQVVGSENLLAEPSLNGANSTSPLSVIFGLLGRNSKPTRPEELVLDRLEANLSVVQERESALISLSFQSTDPALAARIANGIANTHVARRAGLSLSDTAEATEWLLVEIDKMRKRVAEADARVASYRIDNDLFVGTNNTSLLDQQLSAIAGQITTTQERANNAKSRAALIRGLLKAGQPIDGVSDVRESAVVQRLSEEKGRLQGEKALKLATLLPSHPDILAQESQIREIDKQIGIEGRRVADALEAEAKVETDLEQALRDDLTRLKIESSSATRSSVQLNELEREAKAQRDLLEIYLLRYRDASARTDSGSALPDVRVVTAASVSRSPSSPKTGLVMGAVAVAAIMLQLGYILFSELLSGRALTSEQPVLRAPRAAPHDPNFDHAESAGAHFDDVPPDMPDAGTGNYQYEDASVEPIAQHPHKSAGADIMTLADAIAHGDSRHLLVCSVQEELATRASTTLAREIVSKGLSVVQVDASSRQVTADLGLSDLCAGTANFGEVVHRAPSSDLAFVPWGQYPVVNLSAARCRTLLVALADIFEVTLVDAGSVGSQAISAFSDPNWQVILFVPHDIDAQSLSEAKRYLTQLGVGDIVVAAEPDYTRAA